MNLINANFLFTPKVMQQLLLFCSENSYQHISSFLSQNSNTRPDFEKALSSLESSFKDTYNAASSNADYKRLSAKFLGDNERFISLLERMKFENFGGYPIACQNIFHYLYEQRYFNALFLNNKNTHNVLITTTFNAEFKLSKSYLLYNNIYFWSIIGGMHPGILLANGKFTGLITQNTKKRLDSFRTRFNDVCYRLSSTRSRLNMNELNGIYIDFKKLNSEFYDFLTEIKNQASGIFIPGSTPLPASFYNGIDHMIAEHSMIMRISEFNISSLKIPN